MQAEKAETSNPAKRAGYCKRLPGLEQMRFEERLKVEMDIDKDTAEQPVPP